MAHDPLDDFHLDAFRHGDTTHPVDRKGHGRASPVTVWLRALGLADEDLEVVRQGCADEDLCILGLRFRDDALSPGARFARLEREFGDRVVGIQVDPQHANPAMRPLPPHSVVTHDLMDEPGEPTHEARERVLQLFEDTLHPST